MNTKTSTHPVSIEANRLEVLARGGFVPRVQQAAKPTGQVGMLYSVYVDGNRDWASKGITAAEVALFLLARGYLEVVMTDGTVLDADTPTDQYPHPTKVSTKSTYRFLIEPPQRVELYAMSRANHQSNNIQEIDDALEAADRARQEEEPAPAPKRSKRKSTPAA